MKFMLRKKMWSMILAAGAILVCISGLSGCGSKEESSAAAPPPIVTLDGTEIKVGVTTLAELKQAGFTVAKDKHFKEGLDGEEMPGRTYDVGVFLGKDNIVYAKIECLNDKKDPIPYIESTIYNISIEYEPSSDTYDVEHYHENILIDGTSLKGMSVEEVDALLVSKSEDHSEAKYPDGLIYSKSYTIGKNYYRVQFDKETQKVYLVEIEIFKANF